MIDLKKKFTVVEGIYSQEVGEETVLLDMNGEEYFGLNEVGTFIWQLVKEKAEVNDILKQLVLTFEGDQEVILNDLEGLINEFMRRGFIEEVPAEK